MLESLLPHCEQSKFLWMWERNSSCKHLRNIHNNNQKILLKFRTPFSFIYEMLQESFLSSCICEQWSDVLIYWVISIFKGSKTRPMEPVCRMTPTVQIFHNVAIVLIPCYLYSAWNGTLCNKPLKTEPVYMDPPN